MTQCRAPTFTAPEQIVLLQPASAVVQAPARLDRHSFETFIANVAALYAHGKRSLLIDLRQTTHIELSGLFALYCAHLIFQGEQPPSPEVGLWALRFMADQVRRNGCQSVKLINVSPVLRERLRHTDFEIVDSI